MQKILLMIGATLLLPSCSDLNKQVGLKDDNDVEQRIEKLIEDETGIKVDLTPEAKPAPAVKVEVKK